MRVERFVWSLSILACIPIIFIMVSVRGVGLSGGKEVVFYGVRGG